MIAETEQQLAEARRPSYSRAEKANERLCGNVFPYCLLFAFATGGEGRNAGMSGLAALRSPTGPMDRTRATRDAFERNMKEFEERLTSYKQHADDVFRLSQTIY